jgi:hypothetical protein
MRMMLRTQIDALQGGKAIRSGEMMKAFTAFVEKYKPEAVFFTNFDGMRTGISVFEMKSPHEMPLIAEPLFDLGYSVQFAPCMTPADFEKAMAEGA